MTKISRAALFETLNAYVVPGTSASLTTLKAVKGIDVSEGKVTVLLQLLEAYQDRVQVIKQALEELILKQPGVTSAEIEIGWEKMAQVTFKNLIPGIKRCVVVGSGKGGVKAAALRMNLPFLGEVPIDLAIREGGDSGQPLVAAHPDSPQTKVFQEMASTLKGVLKL